MSKVLVAVRVRPLNKREKNLKSDCVISMKDGTRTMIKAPGTKYATGKHFDYDHSFWSCEREDDHYADQTEVFKCMGLPALNNAFDGYNACIFAYGQTGSGKSYSMMGPDDDKGIIPRLCEGMFERIQENTTENLTYKVEVSYLEIYNEKVRDLLGDMKNKKKLKVREHKILGPYVEGLTKFAVKDYATIASLMEEGNKSRTVAATNMNSESSRSHAVFTIVMTQAQYDPVSEHTGEKVARVALVDLAGSERSGKTGATGKQFSEGTNINLSLTTLGLVISALADRSAGKKKAFIPYRDSTLTWLLKDSLGGNSKTAMIATISPAIDNIEETISTLRYADRAKRIVNQAVVNEDPNARLIRELRAEVEKLQSQLGVGAAGVSNAAELEALRQQLAENQGLMQELSLSWEEKLKRAELALKERQRQLEEMGISVTSGGIAVDKSKFYLVNLNADPAMSEMLVYYLKEDVMRVGNGEQAHIKLRGLGIQANHAVLEIEDEELYVTPQPEAQTCVNGKRINERTALRHGHRVLWGTNHIFRVNSPKAAAATAGTSSASMSTGTEWDNAIGELETDPAWEQQKQKALDEQRALFEAEIAKLKNAGEAEQLRARLEAERDLEKLRTEITEASRLIREANSLCKELSYHAEFSLGMRISVRGLLQPNLKGQAAREIAVTQQLGPIRKVTTLERFLHHVEFLREIYSRQEEGEFSVDNPPPQYYEPAMPELIGVAHLFLKDVAHGVVADLSPSIIGQDGRVYGQLKLRLTTEDFDSEAVTKVDTLARKSSQASITVTQTHTEVQDGDHLKGQLDIIEAHGLPSELATNVYCTYRLPKQEEPELVPELESDSLRAGIAGSTVHFDAAHARNFDITVDEDFIDFIANDCVAIEVWGYNTHLSPQKPNQEEDNEPAAPTSPQRETKESVGDKMAMHKKFAKRWEKRTHIIDLWLQVCEVDDEGQYSPVPAITRKDVLTGGILQIRQGFARRLSLKIGQISGSPLGLTKIIAVRFGDIWVREKQGETMSSSSEADLEIIKEKFSHILADRREALDGLMREKIDGENDADSKLMVQWNELVAERAAMMQPEPNSGLLGAIDSNPQPPGYESQSSIVYFPLEVESNMPSEAVGVSHGWEDAHANFLNLHIISQSLDTNTGEVTAQVSWDASAHDNANLLRPTRDQHRVNMRLQVLVQVQGSTRQLVLNKLVTFKVFKRSMSFKPTLKQRLLGQISDLHGVGLKYQVVSSLPSFDTLGEDDDEASKQTIVAEQFQRSVGSFHNLVNLSKRRQELLFLEVTASPGKLRSPSMSRASLGVSRMDEEITRLKRNLAQARLVEDQELVDRCLERLRRLQPNMDEGLNDSWVDVAEEFDTSSESPGKQISAALEQSSSRRDEQESDLQFSAFRDRLMDCQDIDKLTEIEIQIQAAASEELLSVDQVDQLKGMKTIRVRALTPTQLDIDEAEKTAVAEPAAIVGNTTAAATNEADVVDSTAADLTTATDPVAVDTPTDDPTGLVSPVLEGASDLASDSTVDLQGEDPSLDAIVQDVLPGTSSVDEFKAIEEAILKQETVLEEETEPEPEPESEPEVKAAGPKSPPKEKAKGKSKAAKSDELPPFKFSIGQYVAAGSKGRSQAGYIRFYGRTEFADGVWVGVELVQPKGRNDGSVDGVHYFDCKASHGVFVRPNKLTPLREPTKARKSK